MAALWEPARRRHRRASLSLPIAAERPCQFVLPFIHSNCTDACFLFPETAGGSPSAKGLLQEHHLGLLLTLSLRAAGRNKINALIITLIHTLPRHWLCRLLLSYFFHLLLVMNESVFKLSMGNADANGIGAHLRWVIRTNVVGFLTSNEEKFTSVSDRVCGCVFMNWRKFTYCFLCCQSFFRRDNFSFEFDNFYNSQIYQWRLFVYSKN